MLQKFKTFWLKIALNKNWKTFLPLILLIPIFIAAEIFENWTAFVITFWVFIVACFYAIF